MSGKQFDIESVRSGYISHNAHTWSNSICTIFSKFIQFSTFATCVLSSIVTVLVVATMTVPHFQVPMFATASVFSVSVFFYRSGLYTATIALRIHMLHVQRIVIHSSRDKTCEKRENIQIAWNIVEKFMWKMAYIAELCVIQIYCQWSWKLMCARVYVRMCEILWSAHNC